jgi:glycosyltransferase involved in cell wall biosynthesis
MRILYVALDQVVPGHLGGSVHVQSVAEGLARLGHEVHVATTPGQPWPPETTPGVDAGGQSPGSNPGSEPGSGLSWHALAPPLGRSRLRLLRAGAVTTLGRRVGADVVIERYYNFGGEGVLAARRLGVPAVLEVNAPIVDHPGSGKQALDRALLVEPMRRWRERLCRLTDLFVTPSAGVLPAWIDRERVLEIEWGADVQRFRPGATGAVPFTRDPVRVTCVFAGAFRAWHGAPALAAALARLHASGDRRFGGVFIGDGPERGAAEAAARDVPAVVFTGAVAHADLPACLSAADIGVAPFEPERHGPLQLGFFWSPLKIFEYMAAGLPVVAPALPRLAQLVADKTEGLLYDSEDPLSLDRALTTLADPALRARLGAAARARAVRDFSWDAHCRALDARLRALVLVTRAGSSEPTR